MRRQDLYNHMVLYKVPEKTKIAITLIVDAGLRGWDGGTQVWRIDRAITHIRDRITEIESLPTPQNAAELESLMVVHSVTITKLLKSDRLPHIYLECARLALTSETAHPTAHLSRLEGLIKKLEELRTISIAEKTPAKTGKG